MAKVQEQKSENGRTPRAPTMCVIVHLGSGSNSTRALSPVRLSLLGKAICCPTARQTDRTRARHRPTDRSIDRPHDGPSDGVTGRPTDRQSARPPDRPCDAMGPGIAQETAGRRKARKTDLHTTCPRRRLPSGTCAEASHKHARKTRFPAFVWSGIGPSRPKCTQSGHLGATLARARPSWTYSG